MSWHLCKTEVKIQVSLDERRFSGHTKLYLSTDSGSLQSPHLDYFRVHARQCIVQNITVNDRPADFSYHDYLSGRVFQMHGGGKILSSNGMSSVNGAASTQKNGGKLNPAVTAAANIRRQEIERSGGHLLQTSLVPDKDPILKETYKARDLQTFHAAYSTALHEADRGEIILDMSSLPRKQGIKTYATVLIFWSLKNPVAGVYFGGEVPSFSASIQEGDTVEVKLSGRDGFKEGKVTRVNGYEPFTYDISFAGQKELERGVKRHQIRKYTPSHAFTFRRPLGGGIVLGGGDSARSCFPCIDALSERCPWKIIIDCGENLTAVASGRCERKMTDHSKGVPKGMQRWIFSVFESVPAHAIGFAVGQFLCVNASDEVSSGLDGTQLSYYLAQEDPAEAELRKRIERAARLERGLEVGHNEDEEVEGEDDPHLADMRAALDNTVVGLAPAIAFLKNYLFPVGGSNGVVGEPSRKKKPQQLPFGNKISTVFVTNCPVTGAFCGAGLTIVGEDADAESGGLQAETSPGSVNRLAAMAASARQVAWGWFGVLGGADSWRDAALAHGITGFLVDLFIKSVCGDAQFRLRIQGHHDLLLAAASSVPRVVHIIPKSNGSPLGNNMGDPRADARIEDIAGSTRTVLSPTTCSLLSFDCSHVPTLTTGAHPSKNQLPPLIYDAKKHENHGAKDIVETYAAWGRSGDALRVMAARATLLLHSLVQHNNPGTKLNYDDRSRFVRTALQELIGRIKDCTRPQKPLPLVQGQSHNEARPPYRNVGLMSLNKFVESVVNKQNEDADIRQDHDQQKLTQKNLSYKFDHPGKKVLAEQAAKKKIHKVFGPWMRGQSMPRVKCGFVIWDDATNKSNGPSFQAVVAQKSLLPPAGSPMHPWTAPSTQLQRGKYSRTGHESNLVHKSSMSGNYNVEDEIIDVTDYEKTKLFLEKMENAVDLTKVRGEVTESGSDLSLPVVAKFYGEKFVEKEDHSGRGKKKKRIIKEIKEETKSIIRSVNFNEGGPLIEQISIPLQSVAYGNESIPKINVGGASSLSDHVWQEVSRSYKRGWIASLDPDLCELVHVEEIRLNCSEPAALWYRELVTSHNDPIAQSRALRELSRLPHPDANQQMLEQNFFEKNDAGWKRESNPDLSACLILAKCLDLQMTYTSTEYKQVVKMEAEAAELAKRAAINPRRRKERKEADAAVAKAKLARLMLVHPMAGMHIDIRCEAAKALAHWQNVHAPWLEEDSDSFEANASSEDKVGLDAVDLGSNSAGSVDNDLGSMENLDSEQEIVSAGGAKILFDTTSERKVLRRHSLWPGLDILIATFRKNFMYDQDDETKNADGIEDPDIAETGNSTGSRNADQSGAPDHPSEESSSGFKTSKSKFEDELTCLKGANVVSAAATLAKNAHSILPSVNVFADELMYSFKISLVQAIGSVRARNGR